MTDRWKRLIPPLAGVGLVGCVVTAFVLMGGSPGAGDSGAKVTAWFTSHHDRAVTAGYFFAYACAVAVVFYIGMAGYLRRLGSQVLAALTAAGGIVMAGGLVFGSGLLIAMTDSTSKLGDNTVQTLNQLGSDAPWMAMVVGSAVATLAIGIASLRTQAFPKALGIVTVVVGVVQVLGPISWFGLMATAPLTLVWAGYLYQRTGQPASITIADVPDQRAAEPAAPKSRARTKA
jgi:hypothetical protein